MRYDPDHKLRTHQLLLNEASDIIRLHGPDSISISQLMSRAGLTHGGFYAHFRSREQLIAEAVTFMFNQQFQLLEKLLHQSPSVHGIEEYVNLYLSEGHRDRREKGCPVAALSGDIPRQSEAAKKNFSSGMQKIINLLSAELDSAGYKSAKALGTLMISQMVGAIVLSRNVADPAWSREILEQAKSATLQLLNS